MHRYGFSSPYSAQVAMRLEARQLQRWPQHLQDPMWTRPVSALGLQQTWHIEVNEKV